MMINILFLIMFIIGIVDVLLIIGANKNYKGGN